MGDVLSRGPNALPPERETIPPAMCLNVSSAPEKM